MASAEEIKSLMDPAEPLEPPDPSPKELQEKLDTQIEICKILTQQIQNTLFELKILLNGSLDCLLASQDATTTEMEAIENLRDLSKEEQEQTEEKERYITDRIIIRSRVSGVMKTILINIFSGYKEAVDTLIGNLNKVLWEFDEEYGNLMNTYQKLLNKVAKTNLEKFLKDLPTDKIPQLFTKDDKGNPKRLPCEIDQALLTPEILEKQLRRYYETTSPSSE